jgi:hypothetical protein
MAAVAGWATLVIGTAFVVAPRRASPLLGLEGNEAAVRVIGVSDLVLVPGLLRGAPRWPWMAARAAFNLADAVYLQRVASRASSPAKARAGAAVMAALTAIDGATAYQLRRGELSASRRGAVSAPSPRPRGRRAPTAGPT